MSGQWLGRKPVPFRECYPTVKSLRFEGTQSGDLRSKYLAQLHYSESTLPARISCANPRCQQGGYHLQPLLDALVHSKKEKYEQVWHCSGHEGSPKGRRKGDPCMNRIDFILGIEYVD